MFNFSLYSLHEKIYTISFSAAFFGVLLPWLIGVDRIVLGINILFGILIILLLIISAIVSFFLRSNFKKVSIINIILGLICLSSVLFYYLSTNIIVLDMILGVIVRYGIGIYLTIIGSLGIVVSGIVDFILKGN